MANNVLNQLSCAKALSNTGLPTCFFNPKNIEGCILIPKGTTYTQTQQLTLPTVLAAAAINDNIALRIFPIKRFIDFEDQTEDNPTQTFGYGGKEKIRQGKYAWYFMYNNGGMALHTALYSFDGQQELYDVIFIDNKNNCLWGVVKGTNMNELGGFNIEMLDVKNIKLNTGAASTVYGLGFCLEDPDEVNILTAYYQFPTSYKVLSQLSGLKNIQVVVHTPMATGLVKLKLMSAGVDLYDLYSGPLATASLYTATGQATQAGITITSVTATAATKTFDVLVDVLDADYIAVGATGYIDITIGGVAALVAALVVGYGNTQISVVRGS